MLGAPLGKSLIEWSMERKKLFIFGDVEEGGLLRT